MVRLGENTELVRKIAQSMRTGSAGLVYIDTIDYAGVDQIMGHSYCERVGRITGEVLNGLQTELGEILHIGRAGEDWMVFAGFYGEQEPVQARFRLRELTHTVKTRLEHKLALSLGGEALPVYAGSSLIGSANSQELEQLIFSAMKRSIRSIHAPATLEENAEKRNEFHSIIASRGITSVYQPIVSLRDAAVLGFEALTRGPRESVFHSPLELFGYAEAHGELYALDRMAREKAIEGCGELHKDQRVFINIPAQVIHDPQFEPGSTLQTLKRCGINPHNVVLELTERSSIEDFVTAKRVLQHYRNQGYQIAIDDAGAGYSSLQAIAELKPDFIKVDRSLIQDIHLDKMKETILETFVSFARKMSIRIIAEGIESWEELKKLSQMGVHYGQGYLLGRPAPQLSPLSGSIASQVERINLIQGLDSFMQIGNLATAVRSFDIKTPISGIAQYFNQNEDVPGTVVLSGQKPVGLVMREKLFQQLAGQYGVSLYWNRPIMQLMDPNPLVVEETVPIETVSQMAMLREKNRLYDLIVITSKEKMMGVTSIQTLLESITNLRMETARVANPLTGLPGNTQINRELNKRIFDREGFFVIYADLDYFKWFNDRFGFQKGDQLIQFTADVLQQSISACGHPHDFVGHIGGDDFIVISATGDADRLCREMIRRFRQGASLFDENGDWGTVLDRGGNPVDSSGVHISLSLLICSSMTEVTLDGISQAAAALKKKAKAQNGSVYVKADL
jgi:EAL domain-containing protein (putative c-di-GMP-specific phosphodiesterase class I)/GGDEF domain-containing protein